MSGHVSADAVANKSGVKATASVQPKPKLVRSWKLAERASRWAKMASKGHAQGEVSAKRLTSRPGPSMSTRMLQPKVASMKKGTTGSVDANVTAKTQAKVGPMDVKAEAGAKVHADEKAATPKLASNSGGRQSRSGERQSGSRRRCIGGQQRRRQSPRGPKRTPMPVGNTTVSGDAKAEVHADKTASTALRMRTSGPKTEQKIGGTTVTAEAGAGVHADEKGTTASVEAKAHAEGKQGPVQLEC